MANDLTKNPLIIDTAAGTVLWNDRFKPTCIRWSGVTTAGHTVVIQDKNSREVWSDIASAVSYSNESWPQQSDSGWDGFKVTTLASGKLYLYY